MLTTSKKEDSANEDQPKKNQASSDIATILQEAGKALLAKNYIVAHICMRLAIRELMATS